MFRKIAWALPAVTGLLIGGLALTLSGPQGVASTRRRVTSGLATLRMP